MATENKTRRPMNIFEAINQNIVDLSQDVVTLFGLVKEIHAALYPPMETAEPTDSGAEESKNRNPS